MRARVAWIQAALVAALLLAWLRAAPDARLLARAPPAVAVVAHVGTTGLLAMLLVGAMTFRDRPWAEWMGLARMPWRSALLWGLAGAAFCYAANIAAVALYFGARLLASPLVLVLGPDGVVGDEIANKAEWASRLAAIPLGWALAVAAFAGVYEEVLFRGFLLGRLQVALGATSLPPRARAALAVLLSSVAFAAGHGYQGGLGLAQTFAAGLALATLAVYRRSIWPSIVAHASIDAFGLVALHLLGPVLQGLVKH
jgi:membrane protease YdiL (CAAX protease family)